MTLKLRRATRAVTGWIHAVRSPRSRAATYVAIGQWSLLGLMLLAVALKPAFVLRWNEVGLSNYGVHLETGVPYTLALGLGAGLAFASAHSLLALDSTRRRLRLVLVTYGALVLMILASTYGYRLNPTLKAVHVTVNVVTVLFLSGTSAWLAARFPSRSSAGWLVVLVVGLVLAVVDFANLLHVLLVAQLLMGIGFGVLMVRAVRRCDT